MPKSPRFPPNAVRVVEVLAFRSVQLLDGSRELAWTGHPRLQDVHSRSADPVGLVGASGAVCGVFAAIGVWYFLNGKYLPRGMAQRGRSNILTNVILMVFISLVPGVSGYGHLGGALAVGNVLALLRPPAQTKKGELSRAPAARSVLMVVVGAVAAVWAVATLTS